ncbi:MAG TPA: hypothetical protein VEC14_01160 [Reyranellaceae bacterium]|nr:hypothetical protein [Reyranellaceae bacterium]
MKSKLYPGVSVPEFDSAVTQVLADQAPHSEFGGGPALMTAGFRNSAGEIYRFVKCDISGLFGLRGALWGLGFTDELRNEWQAVDGFDAIFSYSAEDKAKREAQSEDDDD